MLREMVPWRRLHERLDTNSAAGREPLMCCLFSPCLLHFVVLLIEVEALLMVECLFVDLALPGERVRVGLVLWNASKFVRWKSHTRVRIGGGTERRRSICWSFLLYVISCAKSAFCAKELQSRSHNASTVEIITYELFGELHHSHGRAVACSCQRR
jgi:hypothetical protein